MIPKRNRSKEEKVEEALDKVQNLEPSTRASLKEKLMLEETNNVVCLHRQAKKLLGIVKPVNKHTHEYWQKRGWERKPPSIKTQKSNPSPFSKEYWLIKGYNETQAEYKRRACIPINREYWLEKGYTSDEAEKLALEQKEQNNKKGSQKSKSRTQREKKLTTPRSLDYWLLYHKGDEELARKSLHEFQRHFTLEQCLEKYGGEQGKEIFDARQQRWQNSLHENNDIDALNESKKNDLKTLHLKCGNLSEAANQYNKHNFRKNLIMNLEEMIDFLRSFEHMPIPSIFRKLNQSQWYYWGIEDVNDLEIFLNRHGICYAKEGDYYIDGRGYYRYATDVGLLRSSQEYAFYLALTKSSLDFEYEKLYNDKNTSRCDFYIPSKNLYIEVSPKYHICEKVKKTIDNKMNWEFPILVVTTRRNHEYRNIVQDIERGKYDDMHYPRCL